MAISITCPDCQTTINVRDELAGRTLKCPGCERELAVEAAAAPPPEVRPTAARATPRRDPDDEPRRDREEPPRRRRDPDEGRPRRWEVVDEDRPRRRREDPDDDYEDEDEDYDYDRPGRSRRREAKRKPKKPMPGWVLAIGIGSGALILIAIVVGIALAVMDTGSQKNPGGTFVPQTEMKWAVQAVPNSPLSVEMPEYARHEKSDQANPFGEVGEGLSHVIQTANGPMNMTASQITGAILGGGNMLDTIDASAKENPMIRVIDRNPVQGRKALTIVVGDADLTVVQRYIQDGKNTYVLSCQGEGISEHTPEVQRFFNSPRFTK